MLLAVRIAVSFAGPPGDRRRLRVGDRRLQGPAPPADLLQRPQPRRHLRAGHLSGSMSRPSWCSRGRTASADLHAADAAAIFFDLGTVGSLIWLGRRIRPGSAGTRLGLVLGLGLGGVPVRDAQPDRPHQRRVCIALLTVLALISDHLAGAERVLLGLATAAKFSPGEPRVAVRLTSPARLARGRGDPGRLRSL